MADSIEVLIIGAGIVGAGVARALARRGAPVFVVEAGERPGAGISSRNSGVIHAGLYYPRDSLKTRLCVAGAEMLYAFAKAHDVPFRKTGKYIVANTSEEEAFLDQLASRAVVPLEPVTQIPDGVRAKRALFSPNTGIVDVHALIEALLLDSDADVVCHQKVTALEPRGDKIGVVIGGDLIEARFVINCAGLQATHFVEGFQTYFARGSYFALDIPKGLDLPALVYPAVPKGSPALGIHLTRNVYGEAYLGPDLEWVADEKYAVDEAALSRFLESARAYLPWLQAAHLHPGYAGIRPKLRPDGFFDFTFHTEAGGRLIHCLGIESPGITAGMAIGEYVADMVYAS